jgi:pimeloyl-ACP methyl ester carboxylesterase
VRGLTLCLCSLFVLAGITGCATTRPGDVPQGEEHGKLLFVGGVQSVGNLVGTFGVPRGMRAAGYRGNVEVFGWQCLLGWTLRDQIDRDRNRAEARRLAKLIEKYCAQHPGRPVDLIALSAGTGVATWALEDLPLDCRVRTVVFLGSSLSGDYDLSAALSHVSGRLHVFSCEHDPILRFMLPMAGSVDREFFTQHILGLDGATPPPTGSPAAHALYAQHVRNHPYQDDWRQCGYYGFHEDGANADFIEKVVAPLILYPDVDTPDGVPLTQRPAVGPRAPGVDSAKTNSSPSTRPRG